MAGKILKTPATLKAYIDEPQEPKEEFDVGKLFHALVLEGSLDRLVKRVDADDYRTKAAREERDKAIREGLIPINNTEVDTKLGVVFEMHEAIMAHPIAGPLFTGDLERNELSAFAKHPSGVWLRGRYDRLTESQIIVDLKTARDADPNEAPTVAARYNQDVQAAHYSLIYELITGQPPRGFVHVNIEKTSPYLISVTQLSPEFMEIGRSKVERAIARFKHATETNEWPGYPAIIHSVEPKPWMIYDEDAQQDREEELNERDPAA